MQRIKALLARVAASPASTVLLTGETGTGKDLAAKAIHYNSGRAARAFVNITCSALPEQLLESELFGHERGAFTDARQQKRGLFETADGGTVFLDEIGEMTAALQSKLLRFLEEKTFKRVGGLADIRVDVRVIAATNRDLEEEVKAGKFREDLFYRLQVMPIPLPPLRERRGDVPLLARYYIDRFNREFKKRVRGLSPAATTLLEQYQWPGNVRELRNAIERAMLLIDRDWLEPDDFTTLTRSVVTAQFQLPPDGVNLDEVERQLVMQALERAGGNQTPGRAAARDQSRSGPLPHREVRPQGHVGAIHPSPVACSCRRRRRRFLDLLLGIAVLGPDGQHRTCRRANHVLGDAAEQQVRHASPPVRADHDQVDVLVRGVVNDLGSRSGPGRCHGSHGTVVPHQHRAARASRSRTSSSARSCISAGTVA